MSVSPTLTCGVIKMSPLRGLELVSVSVSPTLTCGVIRMSPLRGLACWDCRLDAACGGNTDFFFTLFAVIEKCAKDQADFSLLTFFLIKKLAKNQADGKCSRTGLYAPTVGDTHRTRHQGILQSVRTAGLGRTSEKEIYSPSIRRGGRRPG